MVVVTMRWRLRELMARERVSSKTLAERVGVHPVSVARWRAADSMPALNQAQIEAIARAIGCSEAELLGLS